MTKADLIAVVADKLKFPWARAELLVDQIFSCMTEALQQGEGIEIRGFGSFTVREYKAYEGRNPRTGDTVHVKPKRLAFFKVGKELRERVNQGRAIGESSQTGERSQVGDRPQNSEQPQSAEQLQDADLPSSG
jgi:integration host factor subunit beta